MSSYQVLTFSGSDPKLAPYLDLIFSKFKTSLRYGNEWFKAIEHHTYQQVYQKVIENILARPDTIVRIAVLTDDKDVAMGFSISERHILHYVFVKGGGPTDPGFRRNGIGKSLLPPSFTQISHLTKIGKTIWETKYLDVKFNPFE